MNKMLTFFTAPVTAFFYPPVYQDAAKSSAGRGVLYSLYLAVLSTVLIMMVLSVRVVPQADVFLDWLKTNMPVLIWTPAGLSLENGQTTASLVHPQYGKIVVFDMTKTATTEEDMNETYVLVTSQKMYAKGGAGRIEERDITGSGMRSGQQLPSKVRIDGSMAVKMYQNIKKAMVFVIPIVMFVIFLISILVLNLVYSLVGLFLNLMRKERLGYEAIFNLTCFATSVTFTFTWLGVLIPVRALNWPFALNILINLVFMFFAFKITDTKKEAV